MIKLINSHGQLGTALQNHIQNVSVEKDVYIYHTWNPWKRDFDTQEHEYKNFIETVKKYKDKGRIVLISTCSQNDNYYVHFKQRAEAYMISHIEDCLVIRLPNLIGNKGILRKLKERSVTPYGEIEFLTLESAANQIVDLVSYKGAVKSFSLKGETISATLISNILEYTNE